MHDHSSRGLELHAADRIASSRSGPAGSLHPNRWAALIQISAQVKKWHTSTMNVPLQENITWSTFILKQNIF